MIWNEFCKIWKGKTIVLVLLVGGIMFYSEVMGQMNLNYLPLWETVDARVGEELINRYGPEISIDRKEDIQTLINETQMSLEKKKAKAMAEYKKELSAFGLDSYEELEDTLYRDEELSPEEQERMEQIWQVKAKIDENFEWETYAIGYYGEVLLRMGGRVDQEGQLISVSDKAYNFEQSYWKELRNQSIDRFFGNALEKRISQLSDKQSVSLLPSSVVSNMGFVMQNYARTVIAMTILLLFPYLAMENSSGIYPLIATTKVGRKFFLKQIVAVILSELLLVSICSIAFVLAYRFTTPYNVFDQCLMYDIWFDWTLKQTILARLLVLGIGAIVIALLCVFALSFCHTIVGAVAAILPCWAIGLILSLYFFDSTFSIYDGSALRGATKGMSFFLTGLLVALAAGLMLWLYKKRKREDILIA